MAWGDPYTEVSETAKVGTDEQELHKRHCRSDKVAHHTDVQNSGDYRRSTCNVDAAGIDRRTFTLPREVSVNTRCYSGEVSRGHSRYKKTSRLLRLWLKVGGLTEY